MFNFTLFKRGVKENWKTLLIFAAVLSLYSTVIFSMYEPDLKKTLDDYISAMPDIMAAVGMSTLTATLIGFAANYLYGFIALVFPMIFSILCANKLVSRHVDRGSMTCLLAAPVRRKTVAFTQMKVLAGGIFALVLYFTALGITACALSYPGELEIGRFILLNAGLLCLQLFIGGICFLCSCVFSEGKYSLGVGAGIPVLAFVVQMMANAGDKLENMKYMTFFTLFNPDGLIAGEAGAVGGAIVLFAGAIALFGAAIAVFSKKDLHI
ncbi:MAG: ABC transporter permease subunit [Oscillospiraceae bacterium]|jgi:ABC-2 type transport system permease protein|nr:ABC transporter permease subunit [Oscillospiraceae bacterium]